MDTSSSQVPPPPPEARKHSRLGIGSFISATVALLFIFVALLLIFISARIGFDPDPPVMLLACLTGLAALVGTGLGIAAVVQKRTRKLFGILGIIFNGLILLGLCAFFIFIIWVLINFAH